MLESAVTTLLLTSAPIAAIVGTRVRPLQGAQKEARPFLTLSITANQGNLTHSGATGSRNATVEIGIITDTYADAATLAELIFALLHGYRGIPDGAAIRIAPSSYEDESDIEQTTPPGAAAAVYLKTVTYKCRYVNVTP